MDEHIGHEPFSDEIQRLFVWMDRRKRDFFPQEFECVTMRRWDNYFWWIEVDGMPDRTMVEPTEDLPRNPRPLKVHMNVTATNGIRIQSGSKRTTIWLAPELVDFGRRIRINVDGHRVDSRKTSFRPDLAILLEDARARADYQHPFWARIEVP